MISKAKTPTVLVILDGWGYRADERDNAISGAKAPNWNRLWKDNPHTLVSGSGLDVGLPAGQMGNSEVGHMSLGSGRIVFQSISRIDLAIENGKFEQNPAYLQAIDSAKAVDGAVHVMGLLSPGGVHSHEDQIAAILQLAATKGVTKLYLHAFLDGRDTPPRSAASSLTKMDELFASLGCGRTASIVGRYHAMDRDQRWERVERAYRMLTEGKGDFTAAAASEGLQMAYARDENDEFVAPTVIGEPAPISANDSVIFMNFRADRARMLSQAFTEAEFDHFARNTQIDPSRFITTTEYAKELPATVAFPPENVSNSIGEYIAELGGTQLRIAETEKYAHVTFFFSGGREATYPGEKRIMIPSPDVATYDLKPEMSAFELTDALTEAITSEQYDLIVCNYANGDMVGHTGNYAAAVKAVETLDECLAKIEAAVLSAGGSALVTADHGNCEQMLDYESGQAHTQHTTEPVPLVYIGKREVTMGNERGKLADIAPSLLVLMGLSQPSEMTGKSLITLTNSQ